MECEHQLYRYFDAMKCAKCGKTISGEQTKKPAKAPAKKPAKAPAKKPAKAPQSAPDPTPVSQD